tara:strand:- start:5 stop:316 length:312 start_codon:yes stop_codon:yes gene_type:complete
MEDNEHSFWRQASLKIKSACITFILAKIVFFPAALMIFIPYDTPAFSFLRNTFFSLYCLLVFSTLFLCCWEFLSQEEEDIPSEDKVLEWLSFYEEKRGKDERV